MKISLAWISDYIKQDIRTLVTPEEIVARFNQVTAEIEHFYPLSYPLASFTLGKVIAVGGDTITLILPEFSEKKVELPLKEKAITSGELHLLIKENEGYRWACSTDLFAEKIFELPSFAVAPEEQAGGWKQKVDTTDIIFEVDNKSITNRPDLWGHYGLAREISAFLGFEFECSSFAIPVAHSFTSAQKAMQVGSISIKNDEPELCTRYSACYLASVDQQPSDLAMALRLIRIGAKPMNALVDLTNYVLFDLGQPMHAYDAEEIAHQKMEIRRAESNEAASLLSEANVALTRDDLVIADPEKVLCLAGIKGGAQGSISAETKTVLLEAATFTSGIVRKAALRHKLRTESSARFEKTLDEDRSGLAIERFLTLALEQRVIQQMPESYAVLGNKTEPIQIIISHEYLVRRSGINFSVDDVQRPLKAMGFDVAVQKNDDQILYNITVPSYRSSKEIKIKEDILEEVVRHYGFDRIPVEIPAIVKTPRSLDQLFRLRGLKRYCAFGASMIEQMNYAYIDQNILDTFNVAWDAPVQMINPVAENQKTMVQSLLPALLYNVMENMHEQDELRFFEVGKVFVKSASKINEKKVISGLFFSKRSSIDFYHCKSVLQGLFSLCGITFVEWKQLQEQEHFWVRPFQSASLLLDGKEIGVAGLVNAETILNMQGLPESSAFCFELDVEALLAHKIEKRFAPFSKYQGSSFDFACVVPLAVSVASLESLIKSVDLLITDVSVFDFYEKKEWAETRSVGFRIQVQSFEENLTKEVIESVRNAILAALAEKNVVLRS